MASLSTTKRTLKTKTNRQLLKAAKAFNGRRKYLNQPIKMIKRHPISSVSALALGAGIISSVLIWNRFKRENTAKSFLKKLL